MERQRSAMIIDQHPDACRDLEGMLESAGLVVVADAGYGGHGAHGKGGC